MSVGKCCHCVYVCVCVCVHNTKTGGRLTDVLVVFGSVDADAVDDGSGVSGADGSGDGFGSGGSGHGSGGSQTWPSSVREYFVVRHAMCHSHTRPRSCGTAIRTTQPHCIVAFTATLLTGFTYCLY